MLKINFGLKCLKHPEIITFKIVYYIIAILMLSIYYFGTKMFFGFFDIQENTVTVLLLAYILMTQTVSIRLKYNLEKNKFQRIKNCLVKVGDKYYLDYRCDCDYLLIEVAEKN